MATESVATNWISSGVHSPSADSSASGGGSGGDAISFAMNGFGGDAAMASPSSW